jgi:hypothetical protein
MPSRRSNAALAFVVREPVGDEPDRPAVALRNETGQREDID